ncbi:MAG: citrate synthase [Chlamydiae bacterium RIFCSPHIGHO2_12_FULL_44_59]|nr:MAG: citrate synthase [Chlamydiae bacterium RIFCSPHIGHO2_01_FULL_44_39]OGN58262.1 MAG: citrate synthase [Chlamydiae bacterium RIFCSPHIGHO2_02_FULL_45_9]OGN60855.1 MAG: citrate synthase [Chlamydiae bacterium RIFCSPHIGHO2_12_FULL_44_59]OGN66731.1 MAG: citrate synthase [Chlamydiae bacterium RIFCSPLOWO2_01_FULL_44_52]OGN67381.1 MAG: citrate synthase [Chlamydiae bacterium RIFCSPLOWO2_02_FULL_45_22]OGN70656.1 MAG: citrate synthase [Chlamydiae bacterium RIFCSPLOWO2_12_FULL_45_20]
MRDNVLFEITKDHLDTGLRGIPVGYCTTSFVDPIQGLSYVGIPIGEIAHREPTELIYLLYYGEMGSKEEIAKFQGQLNERAHLKAETIAAIERLPQAGHAMDSFSAALLIAGMFEKTEDYEKDCLGVIAKLPEIAARVINHHAGWGPSPTSKPDLGYIENFVEMLNQPVEKTPELLNAMKLFNTIHYDHSGGNLSAFVGKAVASGLEHMYGSLAAAMAALAGPRHGRANQDCLEFVQKVLHRLGAHAQPKDVEQWIREMLAKHEVLAGFGHAVLRVEDARATVCYEYAQKYFPNHPLVKMALLLRTEGSKVLKENPKISDPYPNIDAITGSMLTAAGFPFSDYYTVLFGLSRCVGIAIQIVYERCEARGGKGTPIVRPKYLYKPREI